MTNEACALALLLTQLLADWRFLRRDQIACLMPAASLPLDPLLADLVGEEVLRQETTEGEAGAAPAYSLGRAGAGWPPRAWGSTGLVLRSCGVVQRLDRCSCSMPWR